MIRNSFSWTQVGLALFFLARAVPAQAATLDQSNLPNSTGLNDPFEWQQQVTAGIGGTLAGIVLFTIDGSDTDFVQIGLGPAVFSGSYAFSTTAIIVPTGTFIDTSAAGIVLTPGETFVIDVSGGPGCCNLSGSKVPYPGGDLYIFDDGSWTDQTQSIGVSMAFQTYVGESVPEPGTLALLSCGIILGLAWKARRRA